MHVCKCLFYFDNITFSTSKNDFNIYLPIHLIIAQRYIICSKCIYFPHFLSIIPNAFTRNEHRFGVTAMLRKDSVDIRLKLGDQIRAKIQVDAYKARIRRPVNKTFCF